MGVPVILSSQLVFNMIMFGDLLRTEKILKEARMGTYTVALAAILLPIVGPSVQENQDIIELIYQPRSVLLIGITSITIVVAFPFMIMEDMRFARIKASEGYTGVEYSTPSFITNVLTQSISQVMQSTAAKMFDLVTGQMLVMTVTVWIITTITQTVAIFQQGTTVKQSTFIPMNTMATVLLNAIFGMVVWEDWKVVQSWNGYSLSIVLMLLGNFMISDFFAETLKNRGEVQEETDMIATRLNGNKTIETKNIC